MDSLTRLIKSASVVEEDQFDEGALELKTGIDRFWAMVDRREYSAQLKRLTAEGMNSVDQAQLRRIMEKMFEVLSLSKDEEAALGYLTNALTSKTMTVPTFKNFMDKSGDLLGVK